MITAAELNEIEDRYERGDDLYQSPFIPQLIAAIRELQSQLNSKPKRRSKKEQIEDALRESDLSAQMTGRIDIEYGHHDSLPRGEHVSRLKR